MANSYRVKIAARLRPPITGEINDEGVQVQLGENGVSYICVPNPRDVSQVFKFPCASSFSAPVAKDTHADLIVLADSPRVTAMTLLKRRFSTTTCARW